MTKVVIVDNSKDLCKLYEDTLNCAGYKVQSICDEEKALHVIKNEKPDLVLLGVMMPKISGMHLLSMILGDKENDKTRVIMLTSLSDSGIREKAIMQGACDYIVKSEVGMSELLRRVDKALAL